MMGNRLLALFLGGSAFLAGCGAAATTVGPNSAPVPASTAAGPAFSPDDVSDGRFVRTVTLDAGAFTVAPAPRGLQPETDQVQASILLESDNDGQGPFGCSPSTGGPCVIGFGEVSISSGLAPGVHDLAAWVGARSFPTDSYNCPFEPYSPGSVLTATYPWRYQVAILEGAGTQVLDYTSRASTCGAPPQGPSLTQGRQTLSIPWQLISLHGPNITFRYQSYPCDPYPGIQSMALGADGKTGHGSVGVYITAPYSLTYHDLLDCGGAWTTTTASFGPESPGPDAPPPPTPTVVSHDPTGPVGGSG